MISFELEIDKDKIEEIAKKLTLFGNEITSKGILNQLALEVKDNIFQKTSAGYDYKRNKFKPYNKEYALKKKKTIVDLTDTGGMLNSMTQKVINNDTAKIFFKNTRAKVLAKKHMNGIKTKVRLFFGVNSMDEKLAQLSYIQEIEKAKASVGL